jgi:DNA-binding transcriptional regulator YhcF (GntR family)
LANFILQLVESEGVVMREGYKIPTRYTHRQLATMIGSKRETVTRAFTLLQKAGAVELKRRRIHVNDIKVLKSAARHELLRAPVLQSLSPRNRFGSKLLH